MCGRAGGIAESPGPARAGFGAESVSKMTEKVDVRNHARSLGHRSKVDLEACVDSWVRSIFAVILER